MKPRTDAQEPVKHRRTSKGSPRLRTNAGPVCCGEPMKVISSPGAIWYFKCRKCARTQAWSKAEHADKIITPAVQ
jgi:tRNA(Ile2) C34 agmatinyltransferase TiaS